MHTEEHFYAAIEENPQEGFLKFAFADWLEEQGDARADVIRMIENGELYECVGPPEESTIVECELTNDELKCYALDLGEQGLIIWESRGIDPRPRELMMKARHFQQTEGLFTSENFLSLADQFWVMKQDNKEFFDDDSFYNELGYALVVMEESLTTVGYGDSASLLRAVEMLETVASDPQKQWDWNLLRLAEYQHFSGRKLWTT